MATQEAQKAAAATAAKTEVKTEVKQEAQAAAAEVKAAPVAGAVVEVNLKNGGFVPATTLTVDPSKCPDTHVCMFFASARRVALTSGRIYLFEALKPQYVHRDDRDAVAAAGGGEWTGVELAGK